MDGSLAIGKLRQVDSRAMSCDKDVELPLTHCLAPTDSWEA